MPAALPGSTAAANTTGNPDAGMPIVFDPLTGPDEGPLDTDVAGNATLGQLATGIGFGPTVVLDPGSQQFSNEAQPGMMRPDGTVQDATMRYIGGGRSFAPTQAADGAALSDPYAVASFSGAGNGGPRDAGGGDGYPVKLVVALGTVLPGEEIVSGWINRSGQTVYAGQTVLAIGGTPADEGAITFTGGPIPAQFPIIGVPFSVDLSIYWTGSFTPFTYTVLGGALPEGLTLDPATGIVSGTPTILGNTSTTLQGEDDYGNVADSNDFGWGVVTALVFSGSVGTPRSNVEDSAITPLDISGNWTGGVEPYTFSVFSGTLPVGLALDPATGIISGTPTTPAAAVALVFRATDAGAHTADSNSVSWTITAGGPSFIFSGPIPDQSWAINSAIGAFAQSIVSWWDFEENSASTTFLDSKGSNHLTVVNTGGTAPTTANQSTASGLVGRGMQNENAATFRTALIPRSNTALDLPNTDWSFGGWFKLPGATGGNDRFLMGRIGDSPPVTIQAWLNQEASGGGIQFNARDTAQVQVNGALFATDTTKWRLAVCTFDRTNNVIRLRYRDVGAVGIGGTAVAFPNALYTTASDANFAIWGGYAADNSPFAANKVPVNGSVDSCFYANKAITDAEFDMLYNAGLGRSYAQLSAAVGVPVSLDVSSYWSGGTAPLVYSVFSGTLPAGLTLNSSTGVISGTPTTVQAASAVVLRATDAGATSVNSNSINFTIEALPTVTWNPSDKGPLVSLVAGNLTATKSSGVGFQSVRATRGIAHTDNGYYEIRLGGNNHPALYELIGIGLSTASLTTGCGLDANGWAYYQEDGDKVTNNVQTAYGSPYIYPAVIGVAFKNGKVWFSEDGVWQGGGDPAAGTGEAFSGITGTVFPMCSPYSISDVMQARFKIDAFTYAPPAGFNAWGA